MGQHGQNLYLFCHGAYGVNKSLPSNYHISASDCISAICWLCPQLQRLYPKDSHVVFSADGNVWIMLLQD